MRPTMAGTKVGKFFGVRAKSEERRRGVGVDTACGRVINRLSQKKNILLHFVSVGEVRNFRRFNDF